MKESNFGAGKIIAVVLLIILLVAVAFFATLDGIRSFISNVIHSVISGLIDNAEEFGRQVFNLVFFWQYTSPGENDEGVFIYLVNNDDINGIDEDSKGIRTGLIDANVEMDKVGLDSTIIKEMDVVFNASKGTTSTLVLAELGKVYKYDSAGNKIAGDPEKDVLDDDGYILEEDEVLKITDPEEYIEKFKLEGTERADRVLKKYSSDNMETKTRKIGERTYTLHHFKDETGVSELFWFKADNQFGDEYNNKYYLGAFGVIHIENSDGEEMIYRDDHNLELLIDDYERYQGKSREDAVRDAIERSYGMTNIGTIYVYNWENTTEHTKYRFKDEDAIISEPEETIFDDIVPQTIELEDILDYSKFTIPVELTTNLLNLSGSDEFTDIFMNYALKNTEIHVRLYKNETQKTTYLSKQYDIDPKQFFLEIYNFDKLETFNKYRDIMVNRAYNGAGIGVGGVTAVAEEIMNEASAENDALNDNIMSTLNRLYGIDSNISAILSSRSPDGTTNLYGLIQTEQENGNVSGTSIFTILNYLSHWQYRIANVDVDLSVEKCEDAIAALRTIKGYARNLNSYISSMRSTIQRLESYERDQEADSSLISWIHNNQVRAGDLYTTIYYITVDGGALDIYIAQKQEVYEKWKYGKELKDAILLENKGNDGNGTNVYTVTETKIDKTVTISFTPFVHSIRNWFTEINYEDPHRVRQFSVKKGETEAVNETVYDEYDNLDGYICDENLIAGSELASRGISFVPETIERKEGYGVSGITSNKLWYRRYESVDPKNKDNYENFTIKNLAEEVAVTGEAYDPNYNKSSTKTDFVYSKFNKDNKRAYDGEREKREYYEMGTTVAQTAEERDARIKAFLGLLKNTEGTIEGWVNGFNSDGKVVEYADIYNGKAKVGDLFENGAEMLFQLLESSESTSGLADVFRYIMYIYTGKDYGVTSLDFFTLTRSWSYYGDATTQYIMAWENSFIQDYLNGKRSYDSVVAKYITEDKQYYIVYYENSSRTWNFSYGINIGDTGEPETAGGDYSQLFPNNGLNMPSTYRHEGAQAEVEKMDKVYRDDIARHKNEVMATLAGYGITLSDAQIDALVSIKYQYGNIAGVNDAWIASNNGADLNKFKDTFWVNTVDGGRAYPFKTNIYGGREQANWRLFSEGIYTDSEGNELQMRAAGSGDILEVAEEVHTYMERNYYTYGHSNGGTPAGMRNQRTVNCISFVTWVYCEAGYIDEIYTSCGDFKDAIEGGKYRGLFERINSYDSLQPGDIMYFGDHDHAEIYAGDGYSYNAGTTEAIQRDEPTYKGRYRGSLSFSYGFRLKK